MGTRALTWFLSSGAPPAQVERVATFYRQFDGDPDGHGLKLAQALSGVRLVYGWDPMKDKLDKANGMGDLAALVLCRMFDPATHEIELASPENWDLSRVDYLYMVRGGWGGKNAETGRDVWMNAPEVKVISPGALGDPDRDLFEGDVPSFLTFCEAFDE